MIKAIIFDCFGVLVQDAWLPFLENHFASSPVKLDAAIASNKRVDSGLITYDDFIAEVAALAGISTPQAHQEIEDNPADQSLFEYIRTQLKPRYKLGILSNAGDNWLSELFTPEQLALFDAMALSCEIGAVKPDPLAYQTIARRLDVDIADCLFVDDQPRYCQGARDAGMPAIDYTSLDDLKTKLALSEQNYQHTSPAANQS